MSSIKVLYDTHSSGVSEAQLDKINELLQPEIETVKQAVGIGFDSEYSSINLPANEKMIFGIKKIVAEKKETSDPKTVIVIGIGGSNFGTIAVHEAINGLFYNESNPDVKLYFADSVDSDYIKTIFAFAQNELDQNRNVLLNVVSKSGTTTETIVNFQPFLDLLQKKRPDTYKDLVVVTTNKNSKLWNLAQAEGFAALEVPEKVGGRYSVFSPVGLFPLCFVGIDIEQLLAGAQSMMEFCLQEKNPAASSAAIIFAQYQNGCSIHDTFLFSKDLAGVGAWYRQLVGESLGKETDKEGTVVNTGITPTVSIGTNDLHSVTQLYLAGPYDKFTTFVTVEKGKDLYVPTLDPLKDFVANVQGISYDKLRQAIVGGMYRAYRKQRRPFMRIELPEKTPYFIGQLLQLKMIEVMYLGFLLNVNPFDQPQVELYKIGTREILAGN